MTSRTASLITGATSRSTVANGPRTLGADRSRPDAGGLRPQVRREPLVEADPAGPQPQDDERQAEPAEQADERAEHARAHRSTRGSSGSRAMRSMTR